MKLMNPSDETNGPQWWNQWTPVMKLMDPSDETNEPQW